MHNIELINSSIRLYEFMKKNYKGKQLQKFITDIFKISISTFYNWYKKYKEGVDFYKTSSNRKIKITNEIELFIVEYVKLNPLTKIKKIKIIIKENFKMEISKSSVYTILKKNNLTYKNTYKKINPYTNKQLKYKKTILKRKITKAEDNLLSIDEMSIELNDIPPKGWSPKGKKCYVYTKSKALKGKRFSLLMAISKKNIISFVVVEKGFKSDQFNDFISNNLKNTNFTNKHLLLDNATIHKTKTFKKIIKKENLKVIYNIPYHSEFNPIEIVFSLLRKELQDANVNNKEEIEKVILKFSKEINETKLTNIFNHSFKLLNC